MKYPKIHHLPYSESISNDDLVANDLSSFLNTRIVITEKLDGENNTITSSGVYVRSHTDYTTKQWTQKTWELYRDIKFSRNAPDILDGHHLYGENMYAIHNIEYKQLKSYYYLFGRFTDYWFYSWNVVEWMSLILKIPTVPVLFEGVVKGEKQLKSLVLNLVKQGSKLGAEQMEGCAVRIYDSFKPEDFNRSVVKWVRKNHLQTDVNWHKNYKTHTLIN